MGTQYEAGPYEFDAVGGEETCIELRIPHRGIIRTMRAEQLTGIDVASTFELYTKNAVCTTEGQSSSESGSTVGDRSMYSIFGEKTIPSGSALSEFEKSYHYSNADGTSTNPQRKLYLGITPGGTGAKSFAISFSIETSNLH